MACECCPKCRSENIVDTSPNMWTASYRCDDCKAEWKMIIRNSSGGVIRCYADLL